MHIYTGDDRRRGHKKRCEIAAIRGSRRSGAVTGQMSNWSNVKMVKHQAGQTSSWSTLKRVKPQTGKTSDWSNVKRVELQTGQTSKRVKRQSGQTSNERERDGRASAWLSPPRASRRLVNIAADWSKARQRVDWSNRQSRARAPWKHPHLPRPSDHTHTHTDHPPTITHLHHLNQTPPTHPILTPPLPPHTQTHRHRHTRPDKPPASISHLPL